MDILNALARHNGGQFVTDANELIRECVSEVTRYGQKAKLVIEVTIAPNGEAGLEFSPVLKVTRPARKHGSAFYWPGEDNSLSRTPPEDEADNMLRAVPGSAKKE